MPKFVLSILVLLLHSSTSLYPIPKDGQEDLDQIHVNLKFNNLSLKEALQQLVRQTNLQIIYNDAIVENIRVDCPCRNLGVREALSELLKTTKLVFKVLADGQIIIVIRTDSDRVNLSGYITDSQTGETLPYANISLTGTGYGAASNVNGYFLLLNVPAGACSLRVRYVGYQPLVLSLYAGADAGPVRIRMQQRAMQMQGVTVVGKNVQSMEMGDTPGEIRLSPLQVAKLPNIGEVDIFRSLQLMPGIASVNEGSSGLYVRGGVPNNNLVLFDGITVYHVDHFFGFISPFNTQAVKDIRVFKDGFPAKFGGRTSSVVELTGKSGSFDRFQVGASLSLLSANGLIQMPIGGRGSWLLSFRRSYTDLIQSGLYQDIYNSITRQNDTGGAPAPNNPNLGNRNQTQAFVPDFYYYDLNSKLTYGLSTNDLLSFSFFNSADNLDESQEIRDTRVIRRGNTGPTVVIDDVNSWGNLGFSTKWSRIWSESVFSNYLVAYSIYSSESIGGRSGETTNLNPNLREFSSSEKNEVRDFTLDLANEWQVTASHKLEFGLWLSRTNVDLRFVEDDINILDRSDEAVQTAIYLQDAWKPARSIDINLGLRTTHYEPTANLYVEPRISFRFEPFTHFAIKGAWGEYYQFINRISNDNVLQGNRDYWLLADNQLDPSFARHTSAGFSLENSGFLLDVEGYHKDLDGVAEFLRPFRQSPQNPPRALFNLGTGVAKGIEVLVQKKTGRFNGWASYTLSQVRYKIPAINRATPFPADQDRPHEVKLVGNYSIGPWDLSATWVLASGTPYTQPIAVRTIRQPNGGTRTEVQFGDKNAQRLPVYHRLDLGISRLFHSRSLDWNLGLSVFNLYDRTNITARDFVTDTNPIVVRNVTGLSVTPTITLGVSL